jgi:hypothetical protein
VAELAGLWVALTLDLPELDRFFGFAPLFVSVRFFIIREAPPVSSVDCRRTLRLLDEALPFWPPQTMNLWSDIRYRRAYVEIP